MKKAISTIFILGLLAQAHSAELKVPRDFSTIQKAIDQAKSGDTVLVAAGTYAERVVLKPGVILRSAGDDSKFKKDGEDYGLVRAHKTIINPSGKGPGVKMAEGSTLDGFTITGVGKYDEAAWNKHHATQGEDQEMVHIGAEGTAGIDVNATCEVMNNVVHHIGYTGIAISGAKGRKVEPAVTKNICYRNMGGGIGIMRGANPTVTHNHCYENYYAGIGFTEATGTIQYNHCHHNIRAGIGISEDSSPTVTNNHCHHNRRAGIGIRTGKGTRPLVKENLCTDNDMAGIGSKELAEPTLIGNTCLRNKLAGIGCSEDANATITGNICKENGMSGIGLNGASGTITKNHCEGNKTAALGMQHGAKATASENTLIAKTVVAIGVRNGSQLTATQNKISRKGGMPPLIAVFENSQLTLENNTLQGGGVAAVILKGTAKVSGNTIIGEGPRKVGPPNFAAWVHPKSDLTFNDNKVQKWRHAILANNAKAVTAKNNTVSDFWGTAIVVKNSQTPVTITGNQAISKRTSDKVVDVTGESVDLSGNKVVSN